MLDQRPPLNLEIMDFVHTYFQGRGARVPALFGEFFHIVAKACAVQKGRFLSAPLSEKLVFHFVLICPARFRPRWFFENSPPAFTSADRAN